MAPRSHTDSAISWKPCLSRRVGGGSARSPPALFSPVMSPAAEAHYFPFPSQPSSASSSSSSSSKKVVRNGSKTNSLKPTAASTFLDLAGSIHGPAMVRTHYLNELVDVLRTAKSVEKRAMAEMFLVKVVEREIERVASHVTRKIKGLTAEIESVRSGMGRLTTPFGLSQKLLYLIRSFLESYVTENKSLEKQFPVPALASCRKNLGSYAERHQALDAYFVDMKRDAKELAAKCKTDFVAESLKAFVKMEAEMLLIEKFTTHATAELMSVIGSIEEMTQDLSRTRALESTLLPAMSAAQTLVQTSRIAFVNLVSSLVPSLSDYDCAVCLGTMYEPVQLSTCKHRFCRECLHQHEQFSAFWAYLYWIDVQCPICRGSYTGRHKVLDGAMDNLIKTYFPREHKEKSRDEFRRRMKRKIVMLMRRRIIWRDSLWE